MAAILSWPLCVLKDFWWDIIPRLPHWVRLNIISQLSHFAHLFIRRGSLSCEKYPTISFHCYTHGTISNLICATHLTMSNNSLPALSYMYIYCVFLGKGAVDLFVTLLFDLDVPGPTMRRGSNFTNRDIDWIDNFVNGFQCDAINHLRPNNYDEFRTQRDISSWYVNFGYPDGKVGSCLVNNPTPCEIVRTGGKMTGSHFNRAVTAFHWIANEEMSFDVNLISLFFIPVLLHVIRY